MLGRLLDKIIDKLEDIQDAIEDKFEYGGSSINNNFKVKGKGHVINNTNYVGGNGKNNISNSTIVTGNGTSTISRNGKTITIKGNNISMVNGKIYVDGKLYQDLEEM